MHRRSVRKLVGQQSSQHGIVLPLRFLILLNSSRRRRLSAPCARAWMFRWRQRRPCLDAVCWSFEFPTTCCHRGYGTRSRVWQSKSSTRWRPWPQKGRQELSKICFASHVLKVVSHETLLADPTLGFCACLQFMSNDIQISSGQFFSLPESQKTLFF